MQLLTATATTTKKRKEIKNEIKFGEKKGKGKRDLLKRKQILSMKY